MTTESNRQTAILLLQGVTTSGLEGGRPYLADDFVWWMPARGEIQDRLEAMLAASARHLKAPMTLTVTGTTAEGDRVAVEAVSYGELTNGAVYNNHYHFLLEFKDGKAVRVCEYNDSKHAAEVWTGLL